MHSTPFPRQTESPREHCSVYVAGRGRARAASLCVCFLTPMYNVTLAVTCYSCMLFIATPIGYFSSSTPFTPVEKFYFPVILFVVGKQGIRFFYLFN